MTNKQRFIEPPIKCRLVLMLLLGLCANLVQAKSIENFTRNMQHQTGFFTFYTDSEQGRVYLKINKIGQEFIYHAGLTSRLSSNDIGLDRLQLGQSKLARFDRVGNQVFLRHLNQKFRVDSVEKHKTNAVKQSFSDSILWRFIIKANQGKSILIDLTDFLLSDQYGFINQLEQTNQGHYTVEVTRSALVLEQSKSFPENIEFEVMLTFSGQQPRNHLKQVAAIPNSLTINQHFSFVKLPDAEYQPHQYNIHCRFPPLCYRDLAAELTQSEEKAYILRHRLKKKFPNAQVIEALEPMIYYLDKGIPNTIREAIREGALFWEQSFEDAGYKNAFQVHDMPEDMIPMGARYNFINWAHRKTRGYSTGNYGYDPKAVQQAIDFSLARQGSTELSIIGFSMFFFSI